MQDMAGLDAIDDEISAATLLKGHTSMLDDRTEATLAWIKAGSREANSAAVTACSAVATEHGGSAGGGALGCGLEHIEGLARSHEQTIALGATKG